MLCVDWAETVGARLASQLNGAFDLPRGNRAAGKCDVRESSGTQFHQHGDRYSVMSSPRHGTAKAERLPEPQIVANTSPMRLFLVTTHWRLCNFKWTSVCGPTPVCLC
jgi:hypothetical protein